MFSHSTRRHQHRLGAAARYIARRAVRGDRRTRGSQRARFVIAFGFILLRDYVFDLIYSALASSGRVSLTIFRLSDFMIFIPNFSSLLHLPARAQATAPPTFSAATDRLSPSPLAPSCRTFECWLWRRYAAKLNNSSFSCPQNIFLSILFVGWSNLSPQKRSLICHLFSSALRLDDDCTGRIEFCHRG